MPDRNVKLDVASKAVRFSYFWNVVLQLGINLPQIHLYLSTNEQDSPHKSL